MIVSAPQPARVAPCCSSSCGRRGRRAATLRRPARAAEVGADPGADRGRGAVPADHLRRARRPERADRGPDLARVAVRRAAGAVHPPERVDRPPPGRRHAARTGGRGAGRRRRVACPRSSQFLGALAMIGAAFFYGALELRGQGPLRAPRRGPDVVDLGHASPASSRCRSRSPRRRATRRPRRDRRARRARRRRHGAGLRHLLRADRRHRPRAAPRWSPTSRRASRCSTARSSSTRRSRSPRRRARADPGRRRDRVAAQAGEGHGGPAAGERRRRA